MTTINEKLSEAVKKYDDAKICLTAAENAVKNYKRQVVELEQETIPAILDEAQVSEVTLKDGITIKYVETCLTSLKKNGSGRAKPTIVDSAGAVWSALTKLGIEPLDFLTPVYVLSAHIFELLTEENNDLKDGGYEVQYQYNPAQISALGRELVADGKELDPELFSQYIEPGVKITRK